MRSCASCGDRARLYVLDAWACRWCATKLSRYVLLCAREEWARIERGDG